MEKCLKEFDFFETQLVKRGTKFLGGSEHPGLVDYNC
jgi:hypothetical protein